MPSQLFDTAPQKVKIQAVRQFCSILCALSLLLFAGCGRRETRVELGDREQILQLGSGTEPQELDPHLTTGVTEYHIEMALFEGLAIEDPVDLHPIPGVAESWDISPDAKIYTFHLRKNARWSNGDPLTAHDFLESFKRILTPSLASEYAYMHFVVKNAEAYNEGKITDFNQVGYKVLDDYTLQVTLENATPYFLYLLSHQTWFPVPLSVIRKYGDPYLRNNKWTRPGHFVGNGPFVLDQWRVNDKIVVKKNTNYWDKDTVRLKEIRFYPIDSDDAEERSFRSGQLHVTETVPASKIQVYQKYHPDLIRISPYLGSYFYDINVTKPPLNDKRVRQALSLAIDRGSIVTNVVRGGELPAFCLTPPGTAGYTCRTQLHESVAEAKQLLAEAGYPDGKGLPPIEVLYNTSEGHRAIAEALQQMWKQNLGIDIRLVNEEWKVYLDSQATLNYQISRASWIGDYVDPNTFLDMWQTGNGNNRTGWSNKEYDSLIAEAARTTDPKARLEVFQKAEAILMDELPLIPLYFYTRVCLMRPEVKNWNPTILDDHPYKFVYLEN
jgi:oligopeptide transport system substrate-binding protein